MTSRDSRVCVVTGGARGIGAAIAEKLASEGANVAITDILDDGGNPLAASLCDRGYAARYLRLDVCDPDQWSDVMDAVARAPSNER